MLNRKTDHESVLHKFMGESCYYAELKLLLQRPETKLDITIGDGVSALVTGIDHRRAACVKLFCQDKRATAELLNKKVLGRSPIMVAVMRGLEEIVKILAAVPLVDMKTKNSEGESLIEAARRCNQNGSHKKILRFLGERELVQAPAPQVPAEDAVNPNNNDEEIENQNEDLVTIKASIGVLNDEVDKIAAGIVNLREEEESLKEEWRAKEKNMKDEMLLREKELADTKLKILTKKQKVLNYLGITYPIPECPACLEPMVRQIFSCPNGHLICGACKPEVVGNVCTNCRAQYGGRASATEEMVRNMTNLG